jgi:hypothetical protein
MSANVYQRRSVCTLVIGSPMSGLGNGTAHAPGLIASPLEACQGEPVAFGSAEVSLSSLS